MSQRLSRWLRSDQAVLVILGTHAGLAALMLGWETYVTGNGRFLFPTWWPPVFAAAFVATVLYHRDRSSRVWWRRSGALLMLAYLSRAATLAFTMLDDGQVTGRLGFGMATWVTLALVVEVLWVRIVTPRRPANVRCG